MLPLRSGGILPPLKSNILERWLEAPATNSNPQASSKPRKCHLPQDNRQPFQPAYSNVNHYFTFIIVNATTAMPMPIKARRLILSSIHSTATNIVKMIPPALDTGKKMNPGIN